MQVGESSPLVTRSTCYRQILEGKVAMTTDVVHTGVDSCVDWTCPLLSWG